MTDRRDAQCGQFPGRQLAERLQVDSVIAQRLRVTLKAQCFQQRFDAHELRLCLRLDVCLSPHQPAEATCPRLPIGAGSGPPSAIGSSVRTNAANRTCMLTGSLINGKAPAKPVSQARS